MNDDEREKAMLDQAIPPVNERETARRIPVVTATALDTLAQLAHEALRAALLKLRDPEEPDFKKATAVLGRPLTHSEKTFYTNQWFRELDQIERSRS